MFTLSISLLSLIGCGDTFITNVYTLGEQTSGEPDVEIIGNSNGEIVPTTTCEAIGIDLFGLDGNAFFLDFSPEQVEEMNYNWSMGWYDYTVYDLGQNNDTYADHLYVIDKLTGDIADCGKVQVTLVGQSTGCELGVDSCIPNFSIDVGEFANQKLGGKRRFIAHNAQVGSMYREPLALKMLGELGLETPETSYGWISNSVWNEDAEQQGDGIWVPYVLVEAYDEDFIADHADAFGGDIVEIREGTGDFTSGQSAWINECDYGDCTSERFNELIAINDATSWDTGFGAALNDYLDWTLVKRQMCGHWMFWVGDDYYHNGNNIKVALGSNGRHSLLEWSDDISFAQSWYTNVDLIGWASLSSGCAYDEECWSDVIENVCPAMIDAFQGMNPVGFVDDLNMRLEGEGMLRQPDAEHYAVIRSFVEERSIEGVLESELEIYRGGYYEGCICDTGAVTLGGGIETGMPGGHYGCDCGSSDTASRDTGTRDTGSPVDTSVIIDTAVH